MSNFPGYRSVAYFCGWSIYSRGYRPQYLPVERLTHILYAFADVRPTTGEVVLIDTWADSEVRWETDSWTEPGNNLYGCMKQLNMLKLRNRNLKVLLSIGGWTYSPHFPLAVATAESRKTFARSALHLVQTLGFDGLEIDWEYPSDAIEASSYVSLLYECRVALTEYGQSMTPPCYFELTAACPAGQQQFRMLDVRAMAPYLDFWNIMAYDYAGSWHPRVAHQANLYPHRTAPRTTPFNTAAAVQYYLACGVPADKLVLGMPLYGRGFEKTDGPGHTYDGVGEGSFQKGLYDFKQLPWEGAREFFDADIVATYCYDEENRFFVTYENRESALAKVAFIKQHGLGGAMWWECSGDRDGPDSLTYIVVEALGGVRCLERRPNCIDFRLTPYDNLRNHFPELR